MAARFDYYDILGVSKGASQEEIKKAYRKQALEWHPDRHKDNKEAAEKKFKEINEAYQVLSDSQKRSAYDQFGHDAFSPGGGFRGTGGFGQAGGPFGQSGQWGPFTYTYTTSGGSPSGSTPFGDFGDPFDIFEQFFGGSSPFAKVQRKPRYSITIDFMEAVKGIEKEVEIDGKRKKIRIPAGVDEGSRIRFPDFDLSINVKSHEIFERDGEDVYVKVTIPYSLAVLGGEIEVPTVEESVKIRIRPGTQPGTMVRLKGKGIRRVHGGSYGDEYVRISIAIPEKLSGFQKEVVSQLKEVDL